MNTIYSKGEHYIKVYESEDKATLVGLSGWMDSIELMVMLLGNGYKVAG